ncbi:T9SS type A sorting domain-containing protein [Salegentibacter sp. HM20]
MITNPGTITPEILEGLGVRYDHSRRELMILNPHEIEITEVMLFDLVGKQIQNFVNIPLQKEIKLNVRPINSSVYIVKILTPGGAKNQKFLMK